MTPHSEPFENVSVSDQTGIFDGEKLALSDEVHAPMRATTFTVCELGDKHVAVFLSNTRPSANQRAAVVAAKPDWLNAIVFAEVTPSPEPETATIDAIADLPETEHLATCAVAAAVTAEAHGAFDTQPASYLVRFVLASIAIEMKYDWDSNSWSGTTMLTTR